MEHVSEEQTQPLRQLPPQQARAPLTVGVLSAKENNDRTEPGSRLSGTVWVVFAMSLNLSVVVCKTDVKGPLLRGGL